MVQCLKEKNLNASNDTSVQGPWTQGSTTDPCKAATRSRVHEKRVPALRRVLGGLSNFPTMERWKQPIASGGLGMTQHLVALGGEPWRLAMGRGICSGVRVSIAAALASSS